MQALGSGFTHCAREGGWEEKARAGLFTRGRAPLGVARSAAPVRELELHTAPAQGAAPVPQAHAPLTLLAASRT